jgi:hypothetical protein
MNRKIAVKFADTTVDAVDFAVSTDDLKTMATSYYTYRLSYEYESWAEGAQFAPNEEEWFQYHYAGERLNAIEQILSPMGMKDAKDLAESTCLKDNKIGDELWATFLKAGRQ